MEFFDKKEEVIDLQITPLGKRLLQLGQFKPDSYAGSTLDFTIQPKTNDLIPVRNQLFTIANTDISVTMQDDADTGTTTTSASAVGSTDSITTGTATGSTTVY